MNVDIAHGFRGPVSGTIMLVVNLYQRALCWGRKRTLYRAILNDAHPVRAFNFVSGFVRIYHFQEAM